MGKLINDSLVKVFVYSKIEYSIVVDGIVLDRHNNMKVRSY